MSVWIKCKDKMPPLDEEVLILYKDKEDNAVKSENQEPCYNCSHRYKDNFRPKKVE